MLVLMEMLAHDSQHLRSLVLDIAARYDSGSALRGFFGYSMLMGCFYTTGPRNVM
jgi:hypothetical protein